MGLIRAARLRLRRRALQLRSLRKRGELRALSDHTNAIRPAHILLFCTLRNERIRLPYFLDYYRSLGIEHFLMVDNGSDDGSADYLAAQGDVSVWTTTASYRDSRFGADWLMGLMGRHGHGHWCLTVDADEFFIYPFCDTRPLRALTDWLDAGQLRSFSAMLLDMYPRGPVGAHSYAEGDNPFDTAAWFDPGNYAISINRRDGNLWIQGGPRMRRFFADRPRRAPALNKTPLVRWDRSYVYVSSTHMLLPRGLNQVYDTLGGEKASGILLHAKFLDTFPHRATEEAQRGEHYAASAEYRAYARDAGLDVDFWTVWSERYINWRQLEILGLMSKGNWA